MASQTSVTQKQLKIFSNGAWTTKTIVANTIGELRVELEIPNDTTINISDSLFNDNTAAMPDNETNEDGSVKPLFVAWQSNNKTGGKKQ